MLREALYIPVSVAHSAEEGNESGRAQAEPWLGGCALKQALRWAAKLRTAYVMLG